MNAARNVCGTRSGTRSGMRSGRVLERYSRTRTRTRTRSCSYVGLLVGGYLHQHRYLATARDLDGLPMRGATR